MDIPKLDHIGIDNWKLAQILNLYEGGHALQDIADQVDVEPNLVEKAIELAKKGYVKPAADPL